MANNLGMRWSAEWLQLALCIYLIYYFTSCRICLNSSTLIKMHVVHKADSTDFHSVGPRALRDLGPPQNDKIK